MNSRLVEIIRGNKEKLLLLVVVYVALDLIAETPYLSLIPFSQTGKLAIIVFLGAVLFRLPLTAYALTAIGALLIAVIATLLGLIWLAEVLGNLIFILIFLGFAFGLVDYLKLLKRR